MRAPHGLHDDTHVLPKCCEQPAQALDREAVEPPSIQIREVRLRHTEAARRGPLRQVLRLDQLLNRVCQVGLREQFVGVAQPEVREHVPAAGRDCSFIRGRRPTDLRCGLTHDDPPRAARFVR